MSERWFVDFADSAENRYRDKIEHWGFDYTETPWGLRVEGDYKFLTFEDMRQLAIDFENSLIIDFKFRDITIYNGCVE